MQHAFKFDKQAETAAASRGLPKVDYDFPAGAEKATGMVLVGEAPGVQEVRLGHPFVGRSGQLLDKILARAGIERRQCLVANAFRYQPPGNKVDHFFISRRAAKAQDTGIAEQLGPFGTAYCRAEFAGEIGHLQKTLETYRKKTGAIVLVALGRTPLWALTGENGLLEKIGKPLPCRLAPGASVIPTFHPSFILRGNWGRQDEWLAHFIAALKFLS